MRTLKIEICKKLENTLTSWGKQCKSIFLQRKVVFLASLMEHLQYSPDFTMMEPYHSSLYIKGEGKQNNQVCYFRIDGCKFGNLQYFILNLHPAAIVKVLEPSESTILE